MTTKIPFDDYGGPEPVLLFAHANAYPPACYRQFLEQFIGHYRLLTVHHRPLWPGSRPEELNDWRMIAQDLLDFLDQQGFNSVIAVGHSLGAVVSLMAAIDKPDMFQALVLIEPVFLPPGILEKFATQRNAIDPQDWPFVQTALRRRNSWPDRKTAFLHFREKKVFSRFSDLALMDYVRYGLVESGDGHLKLLYSPEWEARIYTFPPLEVWDLIPQLNHPTLAVRGSETDTLAQSAWQRWQQIQPGSNFIELVGLGHLAPMEDPQLLAREVKQFLVQL